MEDTALKIEYLREIRLMMLSELFTADGIAIWAKKADVICESIEKDFGLHESRKNKEG